MGDTTPNCIHLSNISAPVLLEGSSSPGYGPGFPAVWFSYDVVPPLWLPPMSWLHHPNSTLDAVGVISVWNLSVP